MSGPRIIGLCEGYGGLTMGVQAVLGGSLIAYADIKPAAVALLADRFSDVPNYGDLTTADWTGVEADIVTAGWPCQPHSAAGKRLGEEDPRAIWPAVLDVVRTVRPLLFIGENVARIATNGELRRVVASLAAIGYVGAWRAVPAAAFGAPHKRDRLMLVAVDATRPQGEVGALVEVWASTAPGTSGPIDGEPPALLKTPTAQLAVNGGSQHPEKRKSGGHGPTLADEVEWLLPTPSAQTYGTNQGGAAGRVGKVRESLDTMARRGRFDGDAPANLLPTPVVTDSKGARNATAGRREGHSAHLGWTLSDVARADRWGIYADAIARWETALDRPAPNPTEIGPRGGAVLSPAFVEWMMGVPKGWVTDGAPGVGENARGKWTAPGERNAFLSLLGDGVVPQWAAGQVAFLVPAALTALAELDGPLVRDPAAEVCVVADMEPTVDRLMHLARNAIAAGLWNDEVRERFSARKIVVLQNALVREAKDVKDVGVLRALARDAVSDGLWCDEVKTVFTARRIEIEGEAA